MLATRASMPTALRARFSALVSYATAASAESRRRYDDCGSASSAACAAGSSMRRKGR